MKIIRHIIITLALLLITLTAPVILIIKSNVASGKTDAVTSATVIIMQPTGEYVVLINKDLHTNEDNLKVWETFFTGGEIDFLFEDISCIVSDSDSAGLEIARSFQSRLPENQMILRTEDGALMLSKISGGYFDVAIMSAEFYDAYHVAEIAHKNSDIYTGENNETD